MSQWIQIELRPGVVRTPLGKAKGPPKAMTGWNLKVELEKDGTWRIAPPLPPDWRYYVPDWPGGRWGLGIADELYLYGQNRGECFLCRCWKESEGPCFYGLQRSGWYAVSSGWRRCAKPFGARTNCWSGLAVKGAAGVVIGAEDVPAAVVSWDNWRNGALFNMLSGRLGLVGGFSGGVALVMVTGFPDIQRLSGHSVSGFDWALSVGAKVKGLDKLGKTGPLLHKMLEGINKSEDLIRKLKDSDHTKEVVTLGKSAVQYIGMDWEEPNVTVLDIPYLGAGAELGLYCYWGTCKLLAKW